MAIVFLAIGIPFMIVGFILQFVPINPDLVHLYIDGVRQPATLDTVRTLRVVFLWVFGVLGWAFTIAGAALAIRRLQQLREQARLRSEGLRLVTNIIDLEYTGARTHTPRGVSLLCHLRTAYTDTSGKTFVFRSGLLKSDPTPYLPTGEVIVYCDQSNLANYFVDVDGSIAGAHNAVVVL
ncbi:MAG: hypothetical protein FWG25_06840 [Promicromonosporaceae bacterium]|nr:hypothetical protein [Promicromonosporaceae bacterium]